MQFPLIRTILSNVYFLFRFPFLYHRVEHFEIQSIYAKCQSNYLDCPLPIGQQWRPFWLFSTSILWHRSLLSVL